jgi:hypothetical protein
MPAPIHGLGAVALAGLVLAGATAPGHRYGLTINPAIAVTHPGRTVVFTATDTGRTVLPLTVTTTQVERQGGKCVVARLPVTWAHATPTHFTLTPGGHRVIHVTISRSGPAGAQDLAVNVSTPTGGQGQVHTSADDVGQAAVTFHGKQHTPPCLLVIHPTHRGWVLAGLIALPLGAASGSWVWIRHRRHLHRMRHRRRRGDRGGTHRR